MTLRKKLSDANKSNYQYRRDVSLTLDRVGAAKVALNDVPGVSRRRRGAACAIVPRPRRAAQGRTSRPRPICVVGLYKLATVAAGERKDAVIDEGLQLLARLDADGKLTDDQKGWTESFNTLAQRPRRRQAPPAARK